MSNMKRLSNFRLPQDNQGYWLRVLNEFGDLITDEVESCAYIEIGKQDIRGFHSISLFDSRDCVIKQKHFKTKDTLLGYAVGYLHAKGRW